MIVLGTLGSRVLAGAAEEEAEVEEGRIEEDETAEEEAETAVSFHMLEDDADGDALEVALTDVDWGAPEALVLVDRIDEDSEAESLEVALALALTAVDWGISEALVLVDRTEVTSEADAVADADALGMLEGGVEALVRDSEYEDEEAASEADPVTEIEAEAEAEAEELLESVMDADSVEEASELETESDELDEAVALADADMLVSLAHVDVEEAILLAQSELEADADIPGDSLE